MINTYWTIATAAILGVCTLIFKTKKDEKKGVFNRLTTTGYIFLSLLLFSFLFSWQSEKNKNQLTAAIEKSDSLKYAYKVLSDSLRFVTTLQKLENQRLFDSVVFCVDSNRFDITLSKFGDQLQKQNQTLENIQELQYTLFPLRLVFRFTINLNDTLNECLKKQSVVIKKSLKNANVDEIEFKDHSLFVKNHSLFNSKNINSDVLEALMGFYFQSIPEPLISFYKTAGYNKNIDRKDNFYQIDASLPVYSLEKGKFQFKNCKDYILSLEYHPDDNLINGTVTFEPLIQTQFENQFRSIYTIRNGCYILKINSYNKRYLELNNKLYIRNVSFYCGDNNRHAYQSGFDISEVKFHDEYGYYYRTIHSLISQVDDIRTDFLIYRY